jgi:hypothetical protein
MRSQVRNVLPLALLQVLACRKSEDEGSAAATTQASAVTFAKSDKLMPHELLEGSEKAFALPLPRELKVTYRFAQATHAEGLVASEGVSNFIRARVKEGEIRVGASETLFDRVKVPSDPKRILKIRVLSERGFCRVTVDDVTPAELTGSVEDRMKKAGLTLDGKLLDPKKIE